MRSTHCEACNRELRPEKMTAAERPGTARRATKTLCAGCWTRKARTGSTDNPNPKRDMSGKCLHCDRQMRPSYVPAKDRPGTITHGGYGYCNSCQSRKRRTGSYGNATDFTPVTKPKELALNPAAPGSEVLTAYMKGRQERIARAKRLAAIRAKYGVAA